jgi:hypothetical protein
MFFDSAMISYTVGLGIYLGSVWQQNLDPHSSDDSRNIFIVFLASAVFCFCAFCLLEISPHPRDQEEWGKFNQSLKDVNEERGDHFRCVNRVVSTGEVKCVTPGHSHSGAVAESPKKVKPSHSIFACYDNEDQDEDEGKNRGQV